MALYEMLARKERIDASYQCRHFDVSVADDRRALEQLDETGAITTVHDTIGAQLAELAASRRPSEDLDGSALQASVAAMLAGMPIQEYGRWVFYPWCGRLVHVLPEREYLELRSDRNRYKITAQEQYALRGKRIGVVGLSVGLAVATTLALEGVGGSFRFADFDALSLSNLNRLLGSAYNVGVNKAVLAARAVLEIDPYLDVIVYPGGISDGNLDAFLFEGGKLDLVVEECDDLYMKIRIRERSRELGIPVIMETSDRGLLDIERFDEEPRRPLFHGLLSGLRADSLRGLTTEEKVPFVMRILGSQTMSEAMAASLVEIKQTISGWPQLASGVVLGGALVTDAARRMLLGSLRQSGRYSVDLESIVGEGTNSIVSTTDPERPPEARATFAPPAPPAQTVSCTPTDEQIRYLVAHGIAAPSGGNCQPWRFAWNGRRLECRLDETRSRSFVNFEHLASYVAIGAAVHNMTLASATMGFDLDVAGSEKSAPDAVCSLEFSRQARAQTPDGFEFVYRRCTNRRLGAQEPLTMDDQQFLITAAGGASLQIVSDPATLGRVGAMLGEADRMRFLSRIMHADLMREVRWTAEEVQATRDGLDLATLEFTPTDLAVFRILASWPTMDRVRRLGGGKALSRASKKAMGGACAVALLTFPGTSRASYLEGGRALQRIWLAATARDLGVHPLGLPYMFARLERASPSGYDKEEERTVARLRQEYRTIFHVPADSAEIVLLRLTRAPGPTTRSLRRPVESVLDFV